MSNFAFVLEIDEGANALWKRYLVVYPMQLVEADFRSN
jgi:hypothetical protein